MPATCEACHGLGVAIREDKQHRLFEWPCPYDCPSTISAIIRMHKIPKTKKRTHQPKEPGHD
jgi:hypothetical protein